MSLEYWYVFPFAIFVCIFATSSGFSGAVLFQPFFFFILKIPVANSIATGIGTETIGMTGGAIQYARMGYHDVRVYKILLPFAIIGVLIGYSLFVKLPPAPLKALVGLSMILVSFIQFYSLSKNYKNKFNQNSIMKWRPVAALAGAFSATTGTGVAEMTQPLIEHVGKVPTKKSNATAILLEASADWLITLLNIKLGNIRYDILIFSVTGVLIGSQIGPRIAPYLPDRILKMIFAVSVALIGFFYIWNFVRTI